MSAARCDVNRRGKRFSSRSRKSLFQGNDVSPCSSIGLDAFYRRMHWIFFWMDLQMKTYSSTNFPKNFDCSVERWLNPNSKYKQLPSFLSNIQFWYLNFSTQILKRRLSSQQKLIISSECTWLKIQVRASSDVNTKSEAFLHLSPLNDRAFLLFILFSAFLLVWSHLYFHFHK